jgi:hypothetical protein
LEDEEGSARIENMHSDEEDGFMRPMGDEPTGKER